jgi:hypothetical protein
LIKYIGQHWRGEQNVIWSVLVTAAAFVGVGFLAASASLFAGGVPEHVLMALLIPIYLVIAWALVGTVRAAIATFRNRDAHWISKLVAAAVFVALVPILIAIWNDLGIVRRWLLRP